MKNKHVPWPSVSLALVRESNARLMNHHSAPARSANLTQADLNLFLKRAFDLVTPTGKPETVIAQRRLPSDGRTS